RQTPPGARDGVGGGGMVARPARRDPAAGPSACLRGPAGGGGGADPLGGHGDVELLERLHGRRRALGRAGGPRGARRAVRRLALVTLLATFAAVAPSSAVRGPGSPAPGGAGHRDAAAGGARVLWDTRLLALIPRPGFPALAYVHPDGRIYEGTYDNPAGDSVPSR